MRTLQTKVRHQIINKVRKDALGVAIDGKAIYDKKVDYDRVTRSSWWTVKGGFLELYVNGEKVQFHAVTVTEIIGVLIDTDGRRLEDAYITKSDGVVVRPLNIVYPAFGQSVSVGPGIGFGPVGVGVGVPVGPKHALGLTTATFAQQDVGPEPWMLTFKVEGAKAVRVKLGGTAK